jgi:hypothetical protein
MSEDSADLTPGIFPQNLNWKEGEATESLEELYSFVNIECQRAIDWYFQKKRTKRIAGYLFRVGSILSLAGAGVIPIIGEIYNDEGIPGLSPAWATVALAIAAVLVALDRLGGYTSGWVRYVRSGQTLSQLQSDFRVEWEKQKLLLHGGQVDVEIVQEGIDKCRKFLTEVHVTVRNETNQWAQEFQKILVELENNTNK